MSTPIQLYTNKDITATAMHWGVFEGLEVETFEVVKNLLAHSHIIFDIGANIGLFAIFMAKNKPSAKIYAFEPAHGIYFRLKKNIELNQLRNVYCKKKAVSDVSGRLQLRVPKGSDISSDASLIKDFHRADDDCILETVESITLDDFARINAIEKIDLIKMDVETAEPLVLMGATDILKSHRPIIISEVLHNCVEDKLIPIFKNNDYLNYLISKTGLVYQEHRIDADPTYTCRNFLFVPSEKANLLGLKTIKN